MNDPDTTMAVHLDDDAPPTLRSIYTLQDSGGLMAHVQEWSEEQRCETADYLLAKIDTLDEKSPTASWLSEIAAALVKYTKSNDDTPKASTNTVGAFPDESIDTQAAEEAAVKAAMEAAGFEVAGSAGNVQPNAEATHSPINTRLVNNNKELIRLLKLSSDAHMGHLESLEEEFGREMESLQNETRRVENHQSNVRAMKTRAAQIQIQVDEAEASLSADGAQANENNEGMVELFG